MLGWDRISSKIIRRNRRLDVRKHSPKCVEARIQIGRDDGAPESYSRIFSLAYMSLVSQRSPEKKGIRQVVPARGVRSKSHGSRHRRDLS